jgi:hypothetical protein
MKHKTKKRSFIKRKQRHTKRRKHTKRRQVKQRHVKQRGGATQLKPIFQEHEDKLDWNNLNINSNAITMLEENPEQINWKRICKNPNAIHLIQEQISRDSTLIDWKTLSANPNAIDILQQNIDKIWWPLMVQNRNPNALNIIRQQYTIHPSAIDDYCWPPLSENPIAVEFLQEHIDKIDWYSICVNPNAIHLIRDKLRDDPNAINWKGLCKNTNPEVIPLIQTQLAQNPGSIDGRALCNNPNAIPLIEQQIRDDPNFRFYEIATNPNAIHLIEEQLRTDPSKMPLDLLCGNINAMHIIETKMDEIINNPLLCKRAFQRLCSNPNAIENSNPNSRPIIETYLGNPRNAPFPLLQWREISLQPSIFEEEYVLK